MPLLVKVESSDPQAHHANSHRRKTLPMPTLPLPMCHQRRTGHAQTNTLGCQALPLFLLSVQSEASQSSFQASSQDSFFAQCQWGVPSLMGDGDSHL
ncbi:UNVERIFIED_CONTAM: hypothetical protein GTU68_036691 [Idotea baltica]|nr:hypothetical protein [Idotea baltica]